MVDSCPYCRSADLFTARCDSGPHYARTGCRACGRHIRWEPRPVTFDGAAAFVMPFGKFKGRTLRQVAASEEGRDYLRWLLDEADLKPNLRRNVEAYRDGCRAKAGRREEVGR